ncbi:YceI family protein [Coralloluteibacterium thermophilus]|uniref:YceI family protein n=1 Tax=Coralloluteibacterium thermophilum TaxID=2707049 RepID=A0ABV9NKI1_9GAMM
MTHLPRLLAAALAVVALPALAGRYAPVPDESSLRFASSYEGETFEGRFARFDASIVFDPEDLDTARFDVSIPLSEAGTGNTDRDETLHGRDFFDVARFPIATFVAERFRPLGGDRYAADGMLSLRGSGAPVTLEFTWSGGDRPVLRGEATVNRLEFDVGGGDWGDTALIPDAVRVTTHLMLEPQG